MERLEINGFLTIKEARLDVKRFTILIGPQANGKSVVAKVLYFFRDFLAKQFVQSVRNQDTKPQLTRQALASFEQVFPRYAWSDEDFSLTYSSEDAEIVLSRHGRASGAAKLKFDYSQNLSQARTKAKSHYKHRLEELVSKEPRRRDIEVYWEVLRECIYDEPIGRSFHQSVFIPASRSFFANLQKNVFSFLANNIAIDPLMKEFGSLYESSKLFYERERSSSSKSRGQEKAALRDEIAQEIEKILVGRYVYEDDQDWIVTARRRVNLTNASSGQQEALPLLIVLLSWVYRSGRLPRPVTFFIEEPEAHLFPVSQRLLVGIFSRLYRVCEYDFLLTTHSPYVLTALNNLIMASNLVEHNGRELEQRVKKIIGTDEMIKFEDVRAYTIRNGVLESILDSKNSLIGSSVIDSVSDEFDTVFDKLVQLAPN